MYRVLNIIFRKPVRVFGLGVRETFAEVEREFLQPPVYIILRFLFFFFLSFFLSNTNTCFLQNGKRDLRIDEIIFSRQMFV